VTTRIERIKRALEPGAPEPQPAPGPPPHPAPPPTLPRHVVAARIKPGSMLWGNIVADWRPTGRNMTPSEISTKRRVPVELVEAVIACEIASVSREHAHRKAAEDNVDREIWKQRWDAYRRRYTEVC
jgi:hypothetical protein